LGVFYNSWRWFCSTKSKLKIVTSNRTIVCENNMMKSKHLLLNTEGFNSTPQLYASQTRTSFIHDLWLSIRKKDLLKLFVRSFKEAFFEEEVFSLLSWNIWEVVFCLVSEITGTFATFNTIIFFTSRSEIMFSLQDVKEEREEWKWKRKSKKQKTLKG